ncbi:hypothetical protein CO251_04990 [Sulfobacillus sp. hq2]|nr:hypothetical protein CO251_04990 [Sulfobacillus sp. hq2]
MTHPLLLPMICNMEQNTIENRLHQHGLRATLPRTIVMDTLSQSVGHYTIESLWRTVKATVPSIELSTVYRVVQAFVEVGLASEMHLPDGSRVIEATVKAHAHWVCQRCHAIEHITDDVMHGVHRMLKASVTSRDIQGVQITAWGLCQSCQSATK